MPIAIDSRPAFSVGVHSPACVNHLVLPAGTIVLVSIGGWMLGMRNTMISILSEDYVTMAEAKGLPQRRVMFSYAARNALLPNVTEFGMALGFVIGGALVTEIVFAYPGLGYQLITAVAPRLSADAGHLPDDYVRGAGRQPDRRSALCAARSARAEGLGAIGTESEPARR